MAIGYNGSKRILNAGRSSNCSWNDYYGSWTEVAVNEDGSGFSSYYEWQSTWDYEGDDSGDNFTSTFLMPWPQRSAWIGIFALMLVVAIAGNALVAWIVLANRRMKTVTNYFLVNVSLADLTMSLFNCIFNFTFMLNNHWPFGSIYCTLNNFIANVTVAASVFTLVAISFERYVAIVYPLRPRMSKFTARIAISLIWMASCVLAVPCLLFSQTISDRYLDGEIRMVCLMIWPDGLPNVSQQDFTYNICFTILTYLIPVMVMCVFYTRTSFVLWRSQAIGELTQQQADAIKSKRKAVKMFIVVVTLFTVCWLPYHGYFFYQYIDVDVITYRYTQHIFLAFYWLAMSNAMINPLVYYYMNCRFRQYFKTVICHVFLCRVKKFSMPEFPNQSIHMVGAQPFTHMDGHRYMIPAGPLYGNRESRIGTRLNQQRILGNSLVPSNLAQPRKLNQSKNAENGGVDSNEPHQLLSVKLRTEAVISHVRAPVENGAEGKQQQQDQPAAIRILKRRHRQRNLHGSEPIIGHSFHHKDRFLFQKGNNNSLASSSSESDDSIQLPDPLRHHHQKTSSTLQSGWWVGQQNKPITTWFPWVMAVDTSLPVSSLPVRTLNFPASSNSDTPSPDPASSPAVLYYVHGQRQCSRLHSLSSAVIHDRDFKMVAETEV